LKNSLKSISISTRKKQLVQRVLRPNESGVAKIKHSTDSVLPIQFFKSHAVVSNTNLVENTFTSSGTTGLTTSKHLVTDTSIYTESYQKDFLSFMET
jgi:hypothetical protein